MLRGYTPVEVLLGVCISDARINVWVVAVSWKVDVGFSVTDERGPARANLPGPCLKELAPGSGSRAARPVEVGAGRV